MNGLRLNLACGTDIRDGWVNLDCVSWKMARRGPDVIWDAKDPIPYPDCSIDEIYAGYLFLHVRPNRHQGLLAECRRVLKPGGRFVIGEVAMEVLLPRWLANPSDKYLSGLVWGEQGIEHGDDMALWDSHNQGFTEQSLRDFLASGGFVNARRIWVHKQPDVFYELTLEVFR